MKTECKAQIGYGISPLSGHLNIDAIGGNDKVQCSLINLDPVLSNGQCTHLVGEHVLNFIHHSELNTAIDNWISKLRHGGIITIGGMDLTELSKKIVTRTNSFWDFNTILYGAGHGHYIRGCYDLEFINKLLISKGLRILKKRINDGRFIIEGQRP